MSSQELWKIFTDKNPTFLEESGVHRFTSKGLKKFFDTVWEQAHDQGVKNGRAWEALQREKGNPKESAEQLFKDIFK